MPDPTTTAAATSHDPDQPIAPDHLHHVFLKTSKLAEMTEFYAELLGAKANFANEMVAFLTYDDANHRIALFAGVPDLKPKVPDAAGLDHVGYEYDSVDDLLHTYARLKRKGIEPYWTVNHGPTTSFYYRDPEGNGAELQVDNFGGDMTSFSEFMTGPEFASNPIGVNFDPDQYMAAREAGASLDELCERSYAGEFDSPDVGGDPGLI